MGGGGGGGGGDAKGSTGQGRCWRRVGLAAAVDWFGSVWFGLRWFEMVQIGLDWFSSGSGLGFVLCLLWLACKVWYAHDAEAVREMHIQVVWQVAWRCAASTHASTPERGVALARESRHEKQKRKCRYPSVALLNWRYTDKTQVHCSGRVACARYLCVCVCV